MLCGARHVSLKPVTFLPRDAMLARYAVTLCFSVRLSVRLPQVELYQNDYTLDRGGNNLKTLVVWRQISRWSSPNKSSMRTLLILNVWNFREYLRILKLTLNVIIRYFSDFPHLFLGTTNKAQVIAQINCLLLSCSGKLNWTIETTYGEKCM